MGARDPRIDAYVAASAEFARPILDHLRGAVHAACPEVEETMKWSFPHFMYRGRILCSMASFKQHCAFGFWNGSLMAGAGAHDREAAMGQFGRLASLADLPPDDVLAEQVREAMRLNEAGARPPSRSRPEPRPEPEVPADLRAALEANEPARAAFERFSPSQRREYVEWITEARTEETRRRRLGTAMEWVSEGRPRHWKYLKS